MRKELETDLTALERQYTFICDNVPPILLADLEAIVLLILRVLIAMLKRELKRLA